MVGIKGGWGVGGFACKGYASVEASISHPYRVGKYEIETSPDTALVGVWFFIVASIPL